MDRLYIILIITLLTTTTLPQHIFRKAVYLTQSVGTHIYDHSLVGSPGTTTVQNQVAIYNANHGLTGDSAFTIYNPTDDYPPGGNQLWKWWDAFRDAPGYTFKEDYLDTDTYDIIMIKHCAASQSGIWFYWYNGPQDTLNYPYTQSTYNYQWYVRKILSVMEAHPEKFFFWWNIPAATEEEGPPADMQRLADFNKWMVDTLQAGLDSYGAFPPNVKIFDFFNLLKSPYSNYEDSTYRDSPDDYHPNALASSLVAPVLVQQMFDAARTYQSITLEVDQEKTSNKLTNYSLEQNYPNPFNPTTEISFTLIKPEKVSLKVYDISGSEVVTLVDKFMTSGKHSVKFTSKDSTSGIYFYRLKTDNFTATRKMLLIK